MSLSRYHRHLRSGASPLTRNPRADAQIPTSPRKRGEVTGRGANSFTAAIAGKGFFQCTLPANSFAGFGEGLVAELGLADPPRASHPQPEVVEVEIDDGCRVER